MSKRLNRDQAFLFVCDVQNNFAQDTYCNQGVLATIEAMINSAILLKIPILITEHMKKIQSHTMPSLMKILTKNKHPPFIKEKFSMIVPEIQKILLQSPQRKQIIMVGMQAHICVLQTCLDLIEKNYEVWVVADGITSINKFDRTIGLNRMEKAGGQITSYQTVVFELLKYSSDQKFSQLCDIMNTLKHQKNVTHL